MSSYLVLSDTGPYLAGAVVHDDTDDVGALVAERVPIALLTPGDLGLVEDVFRRAASRGPALVAALLGGSVPAGATLYVELGGDDRHAGLRPTEPMATIAAALARVDRALGAGVDGDVFVEVGAGVHIVEAPIELRNAPRYGGRVVIRGPALGAVVDSRAATAIDEWGLTVSGTPWVLDEHVGRAVVLPGAVERVVKASAESGLSFAELLETPPAPGAIVVRDVLASIALQFAGPWLVVGAGASTVHVERAAVVAT